MRCCALGQPSANQREREKKRTAWAKERKLRAKAVSGPPPADLGTTAAAAAPTAAAMATAATTTAIAATYCEAAMETLPTTAAPRAAAEAATGRMRAASKKERQWPPAQGRLQACPRLPRPPSGSGSACSQSSRQADRAGLRLSGCALSRSSTVAATPCWAQKRRHSRLCLRLQRLFHLQCRLHPAIQLL